MVDELGRINSDYAARAATLVYQLQETIPIYGTDRQ